MKIFEIITTQEPCKLQHPIIGIVEWINDPTQGWVLVFSEGPEKGQCLVVDESVILDDTWQTA
ncbi:MAG: hypothetical protein M0R80_01495 [Proteobacteria bacterium]|jgi:hypothetical protein|nr:hypothetical protein [Pseudomonadota bacterium]